MLNLHIIQPIIKVINHLMKSNDRNIHSLKNTLIPSVSDFLENIKKGNISYLSRAITLIESSKKQDSKKASNLLDGCLPFANNSIRIGITGVPGVGKSTFIEALGISLIEQGNKVAILTVDPSSSIHKGSILGDKTRMENLVKEKNAFIRPSPAGDTLGGVAKKTKETILLCEAAGFNIILVETVGVGQSETIVHSMVDFFLLLKLARAGDELQGIKRGIIELADTIVINKADNDNIKHAELAKQEFQRALHLYPLKENKWQPLVTTCSALHNTGVVEVWEIIMDYISLTKSNNYFEQNRISQNKAWLLKTINQELIDDFNHDNAIVKNLKMFKNSMENNRITPFNAAKKLIDIYRKNKKGI